MYEAGFRPVSHTHYHKLSSNDVGGGGGSISYLIAIFKDGKHFIDSGEYLEVLSPHNTWYQNERIKKNARNPVYDPGTKLDPALHVFGKATVLLEALNAHAA